MCLQALEDLPPGRSWSLLDVGTGSGILAMYGALLGASPVEGVDVDEEALRWAGWNLELNGLSGAVRLSADPPESWKGPFTVVTANLTLEVILALLPRLSRQVAPDGTLVLSGLLREQVPRVTPALARSGFEMTRELRLEEWACLSALRREVPSGREGAP
jgi:ribosomal protein L11 methyltransferase